MFLTRASSNDAQPITSVRLPGWDAFASPAIGGGWALSQYPAAPMGSGGGYASVENAPVEDACKRGIARYCDRFCRQTSHGLNPPHRVHRPVRFQVARNFSMDSRLRCKPALRDQRLARAPIANPLRREPLGLVLSVVLALVSALQWGAMPATVQTARELRAGRFTLGAQPFGPPFRIQPVKAGAHVSRAHRSDPRRPR